MIQTYINQLDAVQEFINSLKRTTQVIGLIASIASVGAFSFWGYNLLLVRDLKDIPVIRANPEPMVVQPEDPGGYQAKNQGFSINQVAETGIAANPPTEVKLAPPPEDLRNYVAKSDLSHHRNSATVLTFPERAAFGRKRGDGLVEMNESMAASTIDRPFKVKTGQVMVSLRPKIRPSTNVVLGGGSEALTGNASNAEIREVAVQDVPAGAQMVQLGAFATRELALAHWNLLQNQVGNYLKGREIVIQKRQSAGRVFYRLRTIGFDNVEYARRFCSALFAKNAECIPVTNR